MREIFPDPNQEVEAWKDAFYNEYKKISKPDRANYLEKTADQILQKYNVKCSSIKVIKKREFAPA